MDLWNIPDEIDFEADTLHKAIIKLHRLNSKQHTSNDDWHLNLLEATRDLQNEKDQYSFIEYLSNPSGYKQKEKLWNQLEDWDKSNTRTVVQKLVQPDDFDWENMKGDTHIVGSTMYIHLKTPDLDEEDEKKEEPVDLD